MIDIIDIGISEYKNTLDLQKDILFKRTLGLIKDSVIITEHYPVFTTGRLGKKNNLLIDNKPLKELDIETIETGRGGDITFHSPGQLVLYPIIDLKERDRDIHLYLRKLENVIIEFLSEYNITGMRIPGATGIWIDENTKIGSIGIGIKKWVTYHGLSININNDLGYFDMILPCGLNCTMTSLSALLGTTVDLAKAKHNLLNAFLKIFVGTSTHAANTYN